VRKTIFTEALISLRGAFLIDADLREANLRGAFMACASLFGADLSCAKLTDANLSGADLSGAEKWTNGQLAQAESLVGAIMPDGTQMTEEAWEEFKKRYRQ
jgi:uncharacterized protein YjbI with pentapeptide repeats